MKSLIIALSLVAANAFALHPNQSWKEIHADQNLQMVTHGYTGAFGQIDLFNSCLTATEIVSLSAGKTCVKSGVVETVVGDSVFQDVVCHQYAATAPARMPRTFTTPVCMEYIWDNSGDGSVITGCAKSANVTRTVPQTIKAEVWGENGEFFSKNYTVPSCSTSLTPKPAK